MLTDSLEKGQGLVEYALILILVAVIVIVVLALLGRRSAKCQQRYGSRLTLLPSSSFDRHTFNLSKNVAINSIQYHIETP